MPQLPGQHIAAIGRHHAAHIQYESSCSNQRKLDAIAASQAGKLPRQYAGVYASMLLLGHLQAVSSCMQRPATIPVDRDSWYSRDSGSQPQTVSQYGAGTAATCERPGLLQVAGSVTGRGVSMVRNDSVALHAVASRNHPAVPCRLGREPLSSAWGLPAAEAGRQSVASRFQWRWLEASQAMQIEDEWSKAYVVELAKKFLTTGKVLDESEVERLETAWRVHAAGNSMQFYPTVHSKLFAREKRISMAAHNANIAAHIKLHCAFETEIYSLDGLHEGRLLLFVAQLSENPFRILYFLKDGQPPSSSEITAVNRYNLYADVLTLGFKSFIGSLIAAYYRHQYYQEKNDHICALRQRRLALATLASSIDIDGPVRFVEQKNVARKTIELEQALPFETHAAFFARNKAEGIEKELFLVASPPPSPAGSDPGKVFLKPKEHSTFEVVGGSSAGTVPDTVHFDEAQGVLKYTGDNRPLPVEVMEGMSLVRVQDQQYPLRMRADGQFEIEVRRSAGETHLLRVYQNPLTASWHLTTQNHHVVFTRAQADLISRLKVDVSKQFQYQMINNRNPRRYRTGILFEVRNKQDLAAATAPLYLAVEMHGNLVPVRQAATAGDGFVYQVFNSKFPHERGFSIEWENGLWRFERWSSPHISRELREQITPDMLVRDVDIYSLSVPDTRGIMRDTAGHRYIKVHGKLVSFTEGQVSYVGRSLERGIAVQYRDGSFQPLPGRLLQSYKNAQADRRAQELLNLVESTLIAKMKEQASLGDLKGVMGELFPLEKFRIEETVSAKIQQRSFVIDINGDQFALESSLDGKQIRFLQGQERHIVLSRHHQRILGGDIEHVLGIKRTGVLPMTQVNSLGEVDQLARSRLEAGARLLRNVLDDRSKHGIHGASLLVCSADFVGSSLFESNLFASPHVIYQALLDFYVPLSHAFPDAIIVPGSIYTASNIPASMRGQMITYRQGNVSRKLDGVVNFVAALVPVFHGGKVLTIARKGRNLGYSIMNQKLPAGAPVTSSLSNLDGFFAANATLAVPDYPQYEGLMQDEESDVPTGSVFAGQTFLPGERSWLEASFLFATQADNVDNMFNNEFMVEGKKFLVVIEDEFNNEKVSNTFAVMHAMSRVAGIDHGWRYDWILHCSAGPAIDERLRATARNYLQADSDSGNELISMNLLRQKFTGLAAAGKVQVYDYRIDGEYS